jgi:hypothetical protein
MPNDKQAPWSTGPGTQPLRKKEAPVPRAKDMSGKPFKKPNLIHRTAMKFIYNFAAPYIKNWRTTLVGIPMLLGGISSIASNLIDIADGKSPTLESWQVGSGLILAGIAAILGKDAKETGLPQK